MGGHQPAQMADEIAFGMYHASIGDELCGAVRRYFDTWQEVFDRDEAERMFCVSTVESCRISVIVLSCALLDYAINFYLGLKCDSALFHKLERRPPLPTTGIERMDIGDVA